MLLQLSLLKLAQRLKLSNFNLNKNNKVPALVGTLFVLLAGILWGTTGIYVRYFNKIGLGTIQITVFKMAFASVFLILFCIIKDRTLLKINIKDLWIFVCQGLISLDCFTYCYFYTIEHTTMSVAAVLLYVSPIIVMILSLFIFKEKLVLTKCLACIVAFVGCIFVAGIIGNNVKIPKTALITGLLSALGYGLYSIFGQIAVKKGYRPFTITTYVFISALIGLLPFIDKDEIAQAISNTTVSEFAIMTILISVMVSLLPYIFYTLGLTYIPASKASVIASIEPVTATLVGLLVFDEVPDIFGFIGIVLVLWAVTIINLDGKKS